MNKIFYKVNCLRMKINCGFVRSDGKLLID